MATATPADRAEPDGDQAVALNQIGWGGYQTLLELRGEKAVPKIIYLDGSALLVSPSHTHEHLAERLGLFVMVVVEELDIPCAPAGSTTFRQERKKGGVEPDKSFYLANEARIRGKRELNLPDDPPPDLVVEAVHMHGADDALEVHRRFGVPEAWVADEGSVRFLVLQEDGRYAEAATSRAFPFLGAAEVTAWIHRPPNGSETEWIKEARRWVRAVLVPRVRGPVGE